MPADDRILTGKTLPFLVGGFLVQRVCHTLEHFRARANVREAVQEGRADFMPIFLSEIPKTGSNKILKRELRQKYWEGHESQVGA